MLEGILYNLTSWLPAGAGDQVAGHHGALPLSYLCSVGGAVILGKFTGSVGMLTTPLNFAALFIGSYFTEQGARQLNLHIDRFIELPLFSTLAGMTVAALCMMMWMKREDGIA